MQSLLYPAHVLSLFLYVATHGNFQNPVLASSMLSDLRKQGWLRSSNWTVDPAFGFHAMLFVHNSTQRGIVAFKGADRGQNRSSESSAADFCATASMFDTPIVSSLDCGRFERSTLDYWTRAVDYVSRVKRSHPNLDISFTGHSIGGALALAIASVTPGLCSPTSSVVAVNPKSQWVNLLTKHRYALPSTLQNSVIVGKAWDPMMFFPAAPAAPQIRMTVCLWSLEVPSMACVACFDALPPNMYSSDCQLCVGEQHILLWNGGINVMPLPQCWTNKTLASFRPMPSQFRVTTRASPADHIKTLVTVLMSCSVAKLWNKEVRLSLL